MLVFCWLWLQIFYNAKEFVEDRTTAAHRVSVRLRFFQYRVDPETRAVQDDLKAMLIKQYKDLGTPK